MDVPGVYAIVNTLNGKVYVGSSQWVECRMESHRYYLDRGEHHNCHLQRAWNKYRADVFEFRVLESPIPAGELLEREFFWIQETKAGNPESGYNITLDPREGSMKGRTFSEDHRRKLNAARRGKTYEEIYGPERAEEIRRKLSEAGKGRTLSEEHRRKLSEAGKGRPCY